MTYVQEELKNIPEITIKIGEWASADASKRLGSVLGSCIGIVLYDSSVARAVLAHVMIPEARSDMDHPAKYGDTAVPFLYQWMLDQGSKPRNILAKVAGGSRMFGSSLKSTLMDVGERNLQSVKSKLSELDIKIVAENTGGEKGRRVCFYPDSAQYEVRVFGQDPIYL